MSEKTCPRCCGYGYQRLNGRRVVCRLCKGEGRVDFATYRRGDHGRQYEREQRDDSTATAAQV